MFGTGEVSTILASLTPPYMLMREDKFPNCSKIFEDISNKPPRPKALGKLFTSVCRLTGIAWIIWAFNVIMFSILVLILVYHWGRSLDMSEPVISAFSCKMFVSMIGALLFIGGMLSFGARSLSMQLSDRCYEHIGKPISAADKQSPVNSEAGRATNGRTRSARRTRVKTGDLVKKNEDELASDKAAS